MRSKNKRYKKHRLSKLTITLIILDIGAFICFFLMYGPYQGFRNTIVGTAMRTMNHQYIARIFFSEEYIDKIMANNYFKEINEAVNLDDIIINTKDKKAYKNKYDKEILTRDAGNNDYKLINIKVGSSDAYLVAIYDPTKVHLLSKEVLGTDKGEQLKTMCKRDNGLVCINGGGFIDYGYGSGIPDGYVIKDSKIIWSNDNTYTEEGQIIGLTKQGKLMLFKGNGKEALKAGIVDGLEFGPFLIVNGKPMEIVGDPWGRSPRVAIAQRKDGIILFLVVDGENYITGASLSEVIETLQLYGAYNAANLDGGTSASLIIKNELINNPPKAKSYGGRYIVTGWGLTK